MSTSVTIQRLPNDAAAFHTVRERVGYAVPDEPVPPGRERWIARRAGEPVARLTTGTAVDLVDAPGRSGLIGHYEAMDGEAGVALLRNACERLADDGAARILGPMNGSTWMRYRLALPAADDPPAPWFLGEPANPPDYPSHFESAGFRVAAEYESRAEPLDAASAPEAPAADPDGLALRPLDPSRFDAELRAIYDLSATAFADNPYYAPLPWERFRSLYAPMRPRLDPELIRLAHDDRGRLAAYAFAYPDPLDAADGSPRVIFKTLAVAPRHRGRGLGGMLMAEMSRAARAAGAPVVVHALMHAANASTRLSSRRSTRRIRRYALYER